MDLIVKKATEQGWKVSAYPIGNSNCYEWSLRYSSKNILREFQFISSVEDFAYELGEIYQAFDVQSEAEKNKSFISKLSFGEILQEYIAVDKALCKLEKTLS